MPRSISRAVGRLALGWWIAAGVGALAATLVAADWYVAAPPDALREARYVGRSQCIDCHQAEHADFAGSHHDRAMELASDKTVLGDFDDAVFERLGVTTRFFRRDGQFWVNTEGPDGEYHDYQIEYTFGVDPLQQYMVRFPDGRIQVLRESWDTHREQWFHVPPPDAEDLRLEPDDPTHWTGIAQNWNSMCAECHSTNLQKNYDLASDSFDTTFSEIDVSCEACHGPGSLHVELAHSRSLFWDRRHGYGLARLKSADSTPQLETCAQCHSRREVVHPDFRPGRPLADHYEPALLREGLYHADGQILDEVYVHGSFLQSRMHREGVRCTDCHNPHSLQLKFQGNRLCSQCHVPARYDTPAHHHHPVGTPSASCVECHMPSTHYMVVDPRRDHSIRVPRPDLTVALGTPNACNACHTKPEESAEWAAEKVVEWYGPRRADDPHWAPAIAAGRAGAAEGEKLLLDLLGRPQTPAIVRATACELLGQYNSPAVRRALDRELISGEAMVRSAAVANRPATSLGDLVDPTARLLSDPVRTVRMAAARRLMEVDRRALDRQTRLALDGPLAEWRTRLELMSERGGSHLQLAQLAQYQGRWQQAEQELRTAMRLAPYLTGIRSELAQLLSELDRNPAEVERLRREEIDLLLRDAELVPDSADVRYRIGLLHYLLGDLAASEQCVAEAVAMEPTSYEFVRFLALLQLERYKQGDQAAYRRGLESLRRMNEISPDNPEAKSILREFAEQRAASPQP